mmetsp:Transcript_380/g.1099  ORF Transcript_380/g.1099 Transcript_380/m.1099 type:complete len:350 (+) Transcript_380:267-1316(+)
MSGPALENPSPHQENTPRDEGASKKPLTAEEQRRDRQLKEQNTLLLTLAFVPAIDLVAVATCSKHFSREAKTAARPRVSDRFGAHLKETRASRTDLNKRIERDQRNPPDRSLPFAILRPDFSDRALVSIVPRSDCVIEFAHCVESLSYWRPWEVEHWHQMHKAAQAGDVREIAALLKEGFYIDMYSHSGSQTPLLWAVINGHEAAVNLMLRHGAGRDIWEVIEVVDRTRGQNCRHYCSDEVVERLLSRLKQVESLQIIDSTRTVKPAAKAAWKLALKSQRRRCAFCATRVRIGERRAFHVCAACHRPRYCGKVCQRNHWEAAHRDACQRVQELTSDMILMTLPQELEIN